MLQYINNEEKAGYKEILGKEQHLNFLRLSILQLTPDFKEYAAESLDEEIAIVPINGEVTVWANSKELGTIGRRGDVFSETAEIAYISTNTKYNIHLNESQKSSKVLLCRTKAERHFPPFIINKTDYGTEKRGKGQWNRTVRNILVDNVEGKVDRLVLGETINDPGQWSGYPPHRHVNDNYPEELPFEEVYFYDFDPKGGFGIQVLYGSKYVEDRGFIIKSGDAFAIPDGFHPVVGAGGYKVYYLWFMAGPKGRKLKPFLDPKYKWVES